MRKLLDELYEWLAARPEVEADLAFGAALDHAEPLYFDRIALLLAQRGTADGFAALLAHYERLAPEVRATLDPQNAAFRDGAARAIKSSSAEVRFKAVSVLLEHPSAKLSYVLPDA